MTNEKVGLIRGLTLTGAVGANITDMVGVGPFITMPYIVAALAGPQAILGWIVGALVATCDGLVWSELGAALPKAGGSYEFLKRIYSSRTVGLFLAFLFAFQLLLSAPTSPGFLKSRPAVSSSAPLLGRTPLGWMSPPVQL